MANIIIIIYCVWINYSFIHLFIWPIFPLKAKQIKNEDDLDDFKADTEAISSTLFMFFFSIFYSPDLCIILLANKRKTERRKDGTFKRQKLWSVIGY